MAELLLHPNLIVHKRKQWTQVVREIKQSTGKTATIVRGQLVLRGRDER